MQIPIKKPASANLKIYFLMEKERTLKVKGGLQRYNNIQKKQIQIFTNPYLPIIFSFFRMKKLFVLQISQSFLNYQNRNSRSCIVRRAWTWPPVRTLRVQTTATRACIPIPSNILIISGQPLIKNCNSISCIARRA